jgi:hypothetical protein
MRNTLLLLLAVLSSASPLLRAQTAPQPASAAAAAVSPAKKELIARVLKAQQAGVDQMARQMVERPALMLLQRAVAIVQARVPADQRERLARDLQADVRKYVDETTPIVRAKARSLAPSAIGPLLEQRLTEAELKEVAGILESAAWRKYQGLVPDLEKALGEKLVAETKAQVEPKVKALEQSMGKRLSDAAGAAASAPASGTAGGK